MNTLEVDNYFTNCPRFLGTYARDQVKPKLKPNTGIVINTDKYEDPGEHWIAIYFNDDNTAVYFYSFGIPPIHDEIIEYLSLISPEGYFHNTVTFQSIYQDTCGMYCVYFLACMFRYKDYNLFLSIFNFNPHVNDILAKLVYKLQMNE